MAAIDDHLRPGAGEVVCDSVELTSSSQGGISLVCPQLHICGVEAVSVVVPSKV